MRLTVHFVFCLLSVTAFVPATAENWMRFRGPNGQGVSSEADLPVNWSGHDNVVWKTSIPGNAWSSPIVYNEYVFLTTAMEDGVSCRARGRELLLVEAARAGAPAAGPASGAVPPPGFLSPYTPPAPGVFGRLRSSIRRGAGRIFGRE